MIPYLGDFAEDASVYIPFNTFSSDDPSASVTITDLVAADIKVHKDGGLTQIATDGATIAIDYDGITGNHLITVDTSASADYSTGSDYLVRVEGTTVDAGTINAFVGQFSIENRFQPSTIATVTNLTNLPTIPANWLTAAGTAADFTTEIQTGLATAAAIAALNDLSPAEVATEILDALRTDTTTAPTGPPAANAPLADWIVWLGTLGRNKLTQDATTQTLRNDADSADIATSTVSDAAGTFTRGEWT